MLRAFILAFGGKGGQLGGLWGGHYRGQGEVHESPADDDHSIVYSGRLRHLCRLLDWLLLLRTTRCSRSRYCASVQPVRIHGLV